MPFTLFAYSMDSLSRINKGFVFGGELAAPYITHLDAYFSKVQDLKLSEDFRQLVLLGELALTDQKASFTEAAQIHAELASSYFHLGELELSLEHSNKCLLMSEYLDEPSLFIKSLYALSAHKRREACLCLDLYKQRVLFQESKSLIHKAIKHFNRYDCNFLKAKILLNGGAAYADDPNGDLEIAIRWYQEAMDLFLSLDKYHDYYRVLIRLGKVWLLQNKYEELTELLNNIDLSKLTKKTKVHYRYLEAQYFIAIKKYLAASAGVLEALEAATALGMKTDINRLNALIEQIQKNDALNPNPHFKVIRC